MWLVVLHLDVPTLTTSRLPRDPSSQKWNYVCEKWTMNFAWNARIPRSIQGSFTCRKSTTWDRRLYFPSDGRRAEDFFPLKNPTAWVPKASTLPLDYRSRFYSELTRYWKNFVGPATVPVCYIAIECGVILWAVEHKKMRIRQKFLYLGMLRAQLHWRFHHFCLTVLKNLESMRVLKWT
jgi:hypothetical protein